ncbi:MAG: L-iditol 2-dehydrogenase [Mycobacterium sp.]|jgi:L-iditol 2-dehydrogenase|nr:L-iditol 2-dehydrogenase [Mycobacterium sp.]
MDATGGRGVDVVIEVAGTDAAIQIAVAAVRPGGRIALGGIPS